MSDEKWLNSQKNFKGPQTKAFTLGTFFFSFFKDQGCVFDESDGAFLAENFLKKVENFDDAFDVSCMQIFQLPINSRCRRTILKGNSMK